MVQLCSRKEEPKNRNHKHMNYHLNSTYHCKKKAFSHLSQINNFPSKNTHILSNWHFITHETE